MKRPLKRKRKTANKHTKRALWFANLTNTTLIVLTYFLSIILFGSIENPLTINQFLTNSMPIGFLYLIYVANTFHTFSRTPQIPASILGYRGMIRFSVMGMLTGILNIVIISAGSGETITMLGLFGIVCIFSWLFWDFVPLWNQKF